MPIIWTIKTTEPTKKPFDKKKAQWDKKNMVRDFFKKNGMARRHVSNYMGYQTGTEKRQQKNLLWLIILLDLVRWEEDRNQCLLRSVI